MSDNHNNHKNSDSQPLSEETREDLRRMTLGLTDQKTIDTLTRVGMMAKNKRESSRAHREQATARAEAEKEATAKKKGTLVEETADEDGGAQDGGHKSCKESNKQT
jgi:hypothetical protein